MPVGVGIDGPAPGRRTLTAAASLASFSAIVRSQPLARLAVVPATVSPGWGKRAAAAATSMLMLPATITRPAADGGGMRCEAVLCDGVMASDLAEFASHRAGNYLVRMGLTYYVHTSTDQPSA